MEWYTARDFNRDFPDDDACLNFIRDQTYPDGITCRTCKAIRRHERVAGGKAFACDVCGTRVSPLAGTIFENSSPLLKDWFYASVSGCTRL